MAELSHFDKEGQAIMVDIGSKAATERVAVATGKLFVSEEILAKIASGTMVSPSSRAKVDLYLIFA